jgi:hypothetical protein
MNAIWTVLRWLAFLALGLASGPLFAKAEAAPEAVLTIANRDITTLRATIQGSTPELRVKRIGERIRDLDQRGLAEPVKRVHLAIENAKGIVFFIGDRQIFVLYQADLDEGETRTLDQVADEVDKRFEGAIEALVEQRSGPVLIKGVLLSLLATAIMLGLLWGIRKATTFLLDILQQRFIRPMPTPSCAGPGRPGCWSSAWRNSSWSGCG